MKVLVVEDDDGIAVPLCDGLVREGYEVERVADGAGALAAGGYDIVLLDLRLPDMDGLDVCREIRRTSSVPVIIVSSRGEEVDRVIGLEVGADDYLVKPFGMRELVARIRAVSRRAARATAGGEDDAATAGAGGAPGRSGVPGEPPLAFGAFTVDVAAHRAWLDGRELALTVKEFGLLEQLVAAAGAVVSRQHLLEHVWGTTWYGPSKTIDMHLANLRRKLGDATLIETVRGVGYRLRGAA